MIVLLFLIVLTYISGHFMDPSKYSVLRFTCDKGQRVWSDLHNEEEIIDLIRGTNKTHLHSYDSIIRLQNRIATRFNNLLYIVLIYGKKNVRHESGIVTNREMKIFLAKYKTNTSRDQAKFIICIDEYNYTIVNILKGNEFYERFFLSSKRTFPDGS